jgi:hypothetical protein
MVSANTVSFMSCRICGPSNMPSFTLASDKAADLRPRYWKHEPLQSSAFTNCFIIPSLICKGGNRTFCGSTKLACIKFFVPGIKFPF